MYKFQTSESDKALFSIARLLNIRYTFQDLSVICLILPEKSYSLKSVNRGESLSSCSGKISFAFHGALLCLSSLIDIHVQAILSVYGCSCCHTNLVAWHCFEGEPLQDYCQGNDSFHQCKLVSNTLPWTTTEGNVPVKKCRYSTLSSSKKVS